MFAQLGNLGRQKGLAENMEGLCNVNIMQALFDKMVLRYGIPAEQPTPEVTEEEAPGTPDDPERMMEENLSDTKSNKSGSGKSASGSGKSVTTSGELRAPDTQRTAKFNARTERDKKACLLRDVTISAAGEILITDGANKKIKVFSLDGKFIRDIEHRDLKDPFGIAVLNEEKFVVTDSKRRDVKVFSFQGDLLDVVGKNLDEYPMKDPRGVAVNSKGDIVVTDATRRCVYVYPLEGAFCEIIWGHAGLKPLQFKNPLYVTTLADDTIVVSDYFDGRVAAFDGDSHSLVFTYGTKKDQKRLRYPRGVCTDRHGNLLVADNYNGKVQVVTNEGTFKQYLVGDIHGIKRPRAVATNGKGSLVVLENGGRVKVYKSLLI